MNDPARLILVGVIAGPHGVRGDVKIKSFTQDPCDIARYTLTDRTGTRRFSVKQRGMVRGLVVASINAMTDRNAVEALKGQELYVSRDALPPPVDEQFYIADLIGLAAISPQGENLGRVTQVLNFGASDILEIAAPDGSSFMVPFTRAVVPLIDLAGGNMTVDRPAEISGEAQS